jgi:putative AdoMet-dependent methyltransferase
MRWPRFTIRARRGIEIFRERSWRSSTSLTSKAIRPFLKSEQALENSPWLQPPRCARVYAVDLSAGMLKYAEKKAKLQGIENVEFLQGGFLTYQHQDEPVDAVVTQLALHHLPDFWKQIALMRVAKMLKDNGKLCLHDVVYSFALMDYRDFFEGYVSKVQMTVGEEFAGRLAAHIRNEYSTLDWIMEGMLQRAGLRIEKVRKKEGFLCLYLCRRTP